MKAIHIVSLCFSVAIAGWAIENAVDKTLKSKKKPDSTTLPQYSFSQAPQTGYSNRKDEEGSNLVDSKNETPAPVEAEQVIKPVEKEPVVEVSPYRIERIHKVMIDGPGKYSILTEHDTGILAHELLYVDDRGTMEAYLHHYIAENSKTDFIQERRTINVRMINDAKKGKMWGEIKKFQPQHFHVELHVNMEQDPIE